MQSSIVNRQSAILLAAAAILCASLPLMAVTKLKRGSDAPEITLKDQQGGDVSLARLRGRVVVLVFGELHHDKTRRAATIVDGIAADPRAAGVPVTPILVVTAEIKPEQLKTQAGESLPATIVRDEGRKAFGAYEVAVMPSVVVIDKEGKVVHGEAGLTSRLGDVATDAVLLAGGRLSEEQFLRTLSGQTTTATAPSDKFVRAERIVQLARQLARRNMDEAAAEKLAEALQVDPGHLSAHLELGRLHLKNKRLAPAEEQFRAALAQQAASAEAQLGIAFIQAQRGGKELDTAEATVKQVLAKDSGNARAHFLLGVIAERRNKLDDAARSFKKAAELLLEMQQE